MSAPEPRTKADVERTADRIIIGFLIVGSLVVAAVCGGIGAKWVRQTTTATCAGHEMSPADQCDVGSTTYNYDEMLNRDNRTAHSAGWIALAIAAVAVLVLLYTLVKVVLRRRRRAAAPAA